LNTGPTFNRHQKTYLRDQIKAAEIGYMSMDILNPPKEAFWGKFNNQPTTLVSINDHLLESFLPDI